MGPELVTCLSEARFGTFEELEAEAEVRGMLCSSGGVAAVEHGRLEWVCGRPMGCPAAGGGQTRYDPSRTEAAGQSPGSSVFLQDFSGRSSGGAVERQWRPAVAGGR